jgi:S1-C subfamily serine protease
MAPDDGTPDDAPAGEREPGAPLWPGADAATVRDAPAVIGERIAVIGYPGGGGATITTGRVLGFTDGPILGETVPAIRVDAEVRPGNSGGPLIDAEGRVIGVIFALSGPGGDGLAVPVDVLVARLDRQGFTPPTGC